MVGVGEEPPLPHELLAVGGEKFNEILPKGVLVGDEVLELEAEGGGVGGGVGELGAKGCTNDDCNVLVDADDEDVSVLFKPQDVVDSDDGENEDAEFNDNDGERVTMVDDGNDDDDDDDGDDDEDDAFVGICSILFINKVFFKQVVKKN